MNKLSFYVMLGYLITLIVLLLMFTECQEKPVVWNDTIQLEMDSISGVIEVEKDANVVIYEGNGKESKPYCRDANGNELRDSWMYFYSDGKLLMIIPGGLNE